MIKLEKCMCLNLTARETHKIGPNFCHTSQSWKSFWLRRAIIPFLIAHITMNFEGFDRVTKFLHGPIKFASFEFPPTLLRSTQDGRWLNFSILQQTACRKHSFILYTLINIKIVLFDWLLFESYSNYPYSESNTFINNYSSYSSIWSFILLDIKTQYFGIVIWFTSHKCCLFCWK